MNKSQWQFGEGNEYLTLDFSRCQRSDGSYYGTGGVCRKGSPADAKEKPAKVDDAAAMKKLGGISVNDPAMREFKEEYDKFAAKVEAARAVNEKDEQKLESAAMKGEATLDKINAADDRMIALTDKANDFLDKGNMEKFEETTTKIESLGKKVDAALEKEFPDYAAAQEAYRSAPDGPKADAALERASTLRQEKLGGQGYEEIGQSYQQAAYDKIVSSGRSPEFESGQGVQSAYPGGTKAYLRDSDRVAEKAVAGLQAKDPNFASGQTPKQVIDRAGRGEGGGRVQSSEMFYGNNGISSVISQGAMSNAFGVDGDSSASTFKGYIGDTAYEFLD